MALVAVMLLLPSAVVAQHPTAAIEWAMIGDPTNPSLRDERGTSPHAFRISKYEITNQQYVIFLNKTARKDPHQLYDARMEEEACGGIERFIEEGECHYRLRDGIARMPVVYVTFLSAMRFANWMHNGHRSSETETGAYDLRRDDAPRMAGARYWIPTDNEWIEARGFDPSKEPQERPGNASSQKDNQQPEVSASTILGITTPPPAAPPSSADFVNVSQGKSALLPSVAGKGAPSPSSTFHPGGNVAEWVDGFLNLTHGGRFQIARGGGWEIPGSSHASDKIELHPRTFSSARLGFRIAAKAALQTPVAASTP